VCRLFLFSLFGLAFFTCSCSRKGQSVAGPDTEPIIPVANKDAVWQEIKNVLERDMTDDARLAVLERFVDIGMSEREIDEVLGGPWSSFGHGPGFSIANYGDIGGFGLVVHFYPDGEAYAIGYSKNGHEFALRSDDPITWPKTKNERYERLRGKETPDSSRREP